jgi:hypothetical protein
MLEAELLAAVLKLAKTHKVLAFHSTDSRKDCGDRGFVDLVLAGSAKLVFAELKSDTGSYGPGQSDWAWRIRACGQTYYYWKPNDLRNGSIERIIQDLHED